jgi:hypothetical protein
MDILPRGQSVHSCHLFATAAGGTALARQSILVLGQPAGLLPFLNRSEGQ